MRTVRFVFICILISAAVLALSSCAPTPDNGQIEAAIRAALDDEALPPDLVFEEMEVPMRYAGKANAVLWTQDRSVQRNYSLTYDGKARAFTVSGFTTSQLSKDGTYHPAPNDGRLVFTEYAEHFAFSSDFNQKYLLFYAGQGDDIAALRSRFESEKLTSLSAAEAAEFEECDLGGSTLMLLVPRYRGMSVWINEIEHNADVMEQGALLARFGDKPVYIWCRFDDKLPGYEVHVSSDGHEEFFLTRKALIDRLRED